MDEGGGSDRAGVRRRAGATTGRQESGDTIPAAFDQRLRTEEHAARGGNKDRTLAVSGH